MTSAKNIRNKLKIVKKLLNNTNRNQKIYQQNFSKLSLNWSWQRAVCKNIKKIARHLRRKSLNYERNKNL
jgi:protoporphyrinogen oxidase